MVPVRAIIKGWRKGVSRLDAYTVDQTDEEEKAAYEKRRGEKRGINKAPFVLMNMWKRVFGSKAKKQQPHEQQRQQQQPTRQDADAAPAAVPISDGQYQPQQVVATA